MDAYHMLQDQLSEVFLHLNILAGERVGPSGKSWQDVAATAATNLRDLADMLDAVRESKPFRGASLTGPVVFPSPEETLLGANEQEDDS
jgi:hypothetical protein